MNRKKFIYIALFCIFISINFLGRWSALFKDFYDVLQFRTEIPIFLSTFQYWLFDIIGILYESIIVACIVGIFSYHFRNYKPLHYIIFGIIARYFSEICLLVIYNQSLATFANEFKEIADFRIYALLSIQFIFTIIASYLGYSIAIQFDFYDNNDKELGYLTGISKKIWVLLFIAFNPVVAFLMKYTLVTLYQFSVDISSPEYWDNIFSIANIFSIFSEEDSEGGLFRLFYQVFSIFFLWVLAGGLFQYGLKNIRDKDSNLRYIKIISIFVIIPMLTLFIPIIRNRTWFF